MALRGGDGFDLYGASAYYIRYNQFLRNFFAPTELNVPGRDGIGVAMDMTNAGFGFIEFIQQYDAQAVWGFHADVLPTAAPMNSWYAIRAGSVGLLQLATLPDGRVSIQRPTGGEIVRSSVPLPLGDWTTVELRCAFGTSGFVELRFEGSTVATAPQNFGSVLPDRLGFRHEDFGRGMTIDNYVVYDGQVDGSVWTTFTGRVRITSRVPFADAAGAWVPSSGSAAYPMVNETYPSAAPDGDTTYIAGTGQQLFEFSPFDCYGLNYGLLLSACARPTAGAQAMQFRYQLAGPAATLETVTASPSGMGSGALANYLTYTAPMALNPETGGNWRDLEINQGAFGVSAAAPGLRVTHCMLEKITSLRPLPFDCGQGSYSYSS